jgi:hypothetical protein
MWTNLTETELVTVGYLLLMILLEFIKDLGARTKGFLNIGVTTIHQKGKMERAFAILFGKMRRIMLIFGMDLNQRAKLWVDEKHNGRKRQRKSI